MGLSLTVLWAIFCPIAAGMAFIITFEEYRRHFPDRRRAIQEGLRAALVTLGIFGVLGVVVAFVLPRVIR